MNHFSLALLMLFTLIGEPAAAQSPIDTPEEYLAQMDTDHDGRVSLAEYQVYMSRAFHALDRNHNDVIDLDEFDPAVVTANTRPLTLAQHYRNLAAEFARLDRNHDGYLDASEIAAPPP